MDPIQLLDETPTLPRTEADEFRPFIPRLFEPRFWYVIPQAFFCCIASYHSVILVCLFKGIAPPGLLS